MWTGEMQEGRPGNLGSREGTDPMGAGAQPTGAGAQPLHSPKPEVAQNTIP